MNSTQPIGGYFELELRQPGSIFHDKAAALNSGRNAFAYILKSLAVKKIYLPFYMCPVMLQPVKQLKIDYAFYHINENLEPKQSFKIGSDEYILYINYFGLKNTAAQKFAQKYTNTIIDNAQAFFNIPYNKIPTFYSPRKFFGVPDGGFAYTNGNSKPVLPYDDPSFNKCMYLLKRIEFGASEGFSDFKFQEQELNNRYMACMSRLTKRILSSIDYEWVRSKRNKNFKELHKALHESNQLSNTIDDGNISGPMIYPFLCDKNKHLREYLHENNIFTATYWPQISELGYGSNVFESYLVEQMIPLPIDQRYDRRDMHRIVSVIKEYRG